ncbi:MAG: arsenate reductase family protein [Opitutaceae bacterium]|nr:arsenate reductase family protein [Opitutaceae bacterium]
MWTASTSILSHLTSRTCAEALSAGHDHGILPSVPAQPITVFTYARCSTCRHAVQWLRERGVAFLEQPIVETPPTVAQLRRMLGFQQGNLRRLFNTSGIEYRALGLATKLPALTETEALALLAGNGRLVKRPFVLGPDFGLVGFDEAKWSAVPWPTGRSDVR